MACSAPPDWTRAGSVSVVAAVVVVVVVVVATAAVAFFAFAALSPESLDMDPRWDQPEPAVVAGLEVKLRSRSELNTDPSEEDESLKLSGLFVDRPAAAGSRYCVEGRVSIGTAGALCGRAAATLPGVVAGIAGSPCRCGVRKPIFLVGDGGFSLLSPSAGWLSGARSRKNLAERGLVLLLRLCVGEDCFLSLSRNASIVSVRAGPSPSMSG